MQARQEREVAGTMFFNFSNFCGEMLSVLGAKGVFDENASGGAQKRMRRSKSAGNRSTAGDDGGSPTEAGLVGLLDNGAVLTEDTLVRCTMYGSMKALEAFQTFSTKSAEVRMCLQIEQILHCFYACRCDNNFMCSRRFRALFRVCCVWCMVTRKRRTPCCACLFRSCH